MPSMTRYTQFTSAPAADEIFNKVQGLYGKTGVARNVSTSDINWINNPTYEAPKENWNYNAAYVAPKALSSSRALNSSTLPAAAISDDEAFALQLQEEEDAAFARNLQQQFDDEAFALQLQEEEDAAFARNLQQQFDDEAFALQLQEEEDAAFARNLQQQFDDEAFALQLQEEEDAAFARNLQQQFDDEAFALQLQQEEFAFYNNSFSTSYGSYNSYDSMNGQGFDFFALVAPAA